ncbi:SgcJ/EcaC family oxidoreductase [Actinophytocola glycyrrhizae]|uniref:SgcJ/EcaC family oxidoreductase n=1 Tax=Actinophytocola glycyrrhizae TaxID=2044873 RepID=A0ABV9S3S0_9PSEU
MRTHLTAIAAAVLLTASASLPAQAGPPRDDALAAFAQIRDRQADAWYREDGAAFAATFTEDADVVAFNGDHLRTRDGIADGMQYYFDTYIDHTRLHTIDEHIRFAGPNLAVIVRTGCQLVPPSTECRPDSLSRNTNVMVKRHGRWLQESFQNTRVMALP